MRRILVTAAFPLVIAFPALASAKPGPTAKPTASPSKSVAASTARTKSTAPQAAAGKSTANPSRGPIPATSPGGDMDYIEEPEALPTKWSFEIGVAGVTDSNINHDPEGEEESDYGAVPHARTSYGRESKSTKMALSYEIASHNYQESERWDRISHQFEGWWEPRLHGRFSPRTVMEVSLKGSSEDRELSNRYALRQELEYKMPGDRALTLYGAFREKDDTENDGRDSHNPHGGLEVEQDFSNDAELKLGYRYEINDAREGKYDYRRSTFEIQYEQPMGSRNAVEVEVKYRPKKYDELVEVEDENGDDEDVVRKDQRWSFSIAWTRYLMRALALVAQYKFEQQTSTVPDKGYQDNQFALGLIRRW